VPRTSINLFLSCSAKLHEIRQLAAEQAYLAAHPEITGQGNYVDDEVLGSDNMPYKTLSFGISSDNILAINQDVNNPSLYEFIFAQRAAGTNTSAIAGCC
jgi:hypothetical protein